MVLERSYTNLAAFVRRVYIHVTNIYKQKIFTYFLHPEADRPMPHPRAPTIRGILQNHTNTNAKAMTNRVRRDTFVQESFILFFIAFSMLELKYI